MELHEPVPPSHDGTYDLNEGMATHSFDPEGVTTVEVEPIIASNAVLETEAENETDAEAARPMAATADPAAAAEAKPVEAGPKLRRKRRVVRKRSDVPAWLVSGLIHVGIFGSLAAVATTTGEVLKKVDLDSSMVQFNKSADEFTKILAPPTDAPRDSITTDSTDSPSSPPVALSSTIGGGAPSSTPRVRGVGRPIGDQTSLPMIAKIAPPSGLQLTSTTPNRDLGGGGSIAGDDKYAAANVGEALDQVAREILRHIRNQKVTVVWLFDESESMRDDQKAIKSRFDKVVSDLKINVPIDEANAPKGKKKAGTGPPLNHAIVGFGDDVHFEQEKPTVDLEVIGRAIDRLRIDTTGKENTMSAVAKVIGHYSGPITQDRKLLIVLVTDESGDDGDYIEEARQAAVSRDVPIYIIGRQALFGHTLLSIDYKDPVTGDTYRTHIRRGPETADVESLQYDGLHARWDEIPSGFAPYELGRLAKETSGIYFLLPSEENQRVVRREKAFSYDAIKEYAPLNESRPAYAERRQKSKLRRTLYEVINESRKFPFRHAYPVMPDELIPMIDQELPIVTERLNTLIAIEKVLKDLQPLRDRETEIRWQAAYDLMLAQVVAYQIKAYEYRANLQEMRAKPPKPSKLPSPELTVQWWLNHSQTHKAPKERTEKQYAEATRLFKLVIERHPNTPWADLAQDEINRGFSVQRDEWSHKHDARYQERAKLVPKF